MTPKFPCGTYSKVVAKNHNAVCCGICNLRVYIKCNILTNSVTENFNRVMSHGIVKNV